MRLEQHLERWSVIPITRIISVKAFMAVVDDEELSVRARDDAAETVWFQVWKGKGETGMYFPGISRSGSSFYLCGGKEAKGED